MSQKETKEHKFTPAAHLCAGSSGDFGKIGNHAYCQQCGGCAIPSCGWHDPQHAFSAYPESDLVQPKELKKLDQDKVPLQLVPASLMWSVATILAFGAKKYAPRAWEKGMEWSRVYGALLRHLTCWFAGKGPTSRSFIWGELDSETKHSHLWHAGCCLAFLIEYEETNVGTDDRPRSAVEKGDK